MSPQAQSTTLSSATSEIDDDLAPPKRKTGVVVALIGGLAAAAAVAFLVLPKNGDKKAEDAPTTHVAALPSPTGPAESAKPTTVTIRFQATPAGTHVFRKSDGTDLGVAPLELKLPRNGSVNDYLLKKDGYKELAMRADLSEDNTLEAALEKLPEPVAAKPTEPEPVKKKPSGARKGGGKRKSGGGSVPDEDGLATPSF
jgi:hypothetical protein